MPALKVELLFDMTAELGEVQEVGATPHGTRRIIVVQGGTFEGPKLKGTILPGGGDWQLIRPDGTAEIDVRLTLRTDDGHLIYMTYTGIRTGPPEVLQRLARGEAVDPSEYYFRTTPLFEAGAEKYDWLNRIVAIGEGRRAPTVVRYSVYAVL